MFTRYRLVDRAAGQPQKELAALFVVRLDGSRLRRITAWSLRAGDADWSPSGRSIVFETNFDAFDNHPADVFTVGSGGGRPRNLTRNAGRTGSGATLRIDGSSDPVWSPDGRSILFLDVHDTAAAPRSGLARMRPDGSRRRFVSADPQAEHQVDVEVAPRRR